MRKTIAVVLLLLLHSTTEIVTAASVRFSEETNLVSLGPVFGEVPHEVEAAVGHTVILSCIIHNAGDRTVSWLRMKDYSILLMNNTKFTTNPRIDRQDPPPARNVWNLVISNVQRSDEGVYECQVSTEPKMKSIVKLKVIESSEPEVAMADTPFVTTQIAGPREEVVKVGSVVTFQCSAVHRLNGSEGGRVTWLKDGRPVEKHESPRGGVSVYTEWKPHVVVSRLTLIASDTEDNGAYSCSIPGSGTDTVMLLIDAGKAGLLTSSASASRAAALLPLALLLYSVRN
ncbi:leucine-rich repeats and immunoglobulin-like domains protein 1 [Phlebotomus argentipes]|uniref:leucine-rich repeats and immunoglobulin-like domains protein 1 n=1 Tax=Phlebotomus argentipes TaxID=94469 RepID=UPI002892C183|nr:leucine-rich repeats and immunoglobulin-like domains protein 1 [Phlebotomus argentipes]